MNKLQLRVGIMKKIASIVLLLMPVIVSAESLDFIRETGKINVVFGVIFIIFIGIICFLILLERKIKKLEKRIHHE
jgi:CcmD family protein